MEVALEILRQRRAALDPVAAVQVAEALDVAHLGAVDMAADDALDAVLARELHHAVLELCDVADGRLGVVLEVGGDAAV